MPSFDAKQPALEPQRRAIARPWRDARPRARHTTTAMRRCSTSTATSCMSTGRTHSTVRRAQQEPRPGTKSSTSVLERASARCCSHSASSTRRSSCTIFAPSNAAPHRRQGRCRRGLSGRVLTVAADLDVTWPSLEPIHLTWHPEVTVIGVTHRARERVREHPARWTCRRRRVRYHLRFLPDDLDGTPGLELRLLDVVRAEEEYDPPELGSNWSARLIGWFRRRRAGLHRRATALAGYRETRGCDSSAWRGLRIRVRDDQRSAELLDPDAL